MPGPAQLVVTGEWKGRPMDKWPGGAEVPHVPLDYIEK